MDDAVIGPRAQIGAGAHVASGAVVGPGVVDSPQVRASPQVSACSPREPAPERRRAVTRYEEMLGLVGQLGAQLREGYAAGQAALGAPQGEPPATATISALGGSAIGGSLAEALWRDTARVPVAVNRAATLPAWVGPGHLVLPVSYSGSTAETLAATRSAVERGAGVIAVTAGEPLGGLVGAAGGQVVRVPGGLPPRAALGRCSGRGGRPRALGLRACGRGCDPRRGARVRRRRARPRRQPRMPTARGGHHGPEQGPGCGPLGRARPFLRSARHAAERLAGGHRDDVGAARDGGALRVERLRGRAAVGHRHHRGGPVRPRPAARRRG